LTFPAASTSPRLGFGERATAAWGYAPGHPSENVRCPVSRWALVAGLAGALGTTAAEHQHRHRQAHPEQGSRHGQRPKTAVVAWFVVN
jgi:hypothetical protein